MLCRNFFRAECFEIVLELRPRVRKRFPGKFLETCRRFFFMAEKISHEKNERCGLVSERASGFGFFS